jgi:hypothetical protein
MGKNVQKTHLKSYKLGQCSLYSLDVTVQNLYKYKSKYVLLDTTVPAR